MSRMLYVIYCDDVRMEVNGKTSLIGVFADTMLVPSFPAHIMKICAVVNAITPEGRPFKGFKLTASYNGNAVAEMEVTPEQFQQQVAEPNGSGPQTIQAQMIFSPLLLDKPGELKVTLEADGETLDSNALKAMVMPEGMQFYP